MSNVSEQRESEQTGQSGQRETSEMSEQIERSESSSERKNICMIGVTPERIHLTRKLVKDLLGYKFDKIYLCIPRVTRCGESFIGISEFNFPEKVEVIRGVDYGGITPIVYSSMIPERGNVFIVNDSMTLSIDPTSILSPKLNRNNVVGFYGVCVGTLPFNFQLLGSNEVDRTVDFLLLSHVICFRSDQFNTRNLANFHPELIGYPDLRFSLWCETLKQNRVSVGVASRDIVKLHPHTESIFRWKFLKKAFLIRWYSTDNVRFKESHLGVFYTSLGFLFLLLLLIFILTVCFFSLKACVLGILALCTVYKTFMWKFAP